MRQLQRSFVFLLSFLIPLPVFALRVEPPAETGLEELLQLELEAPPELPPVAAGAEEQTAEPFPKKSLLERIRAALRGHPGGPLVIEEFAASLDGNRFTVNRYLYSLDLVNEENRRRSEEKPALLLIEVVASHGTDPVSRISKTLRAYAGGPLTSSQLSALSGVDLFHLKTYQAGALVIQENARRSALVPAGPSILFIDRGSIDPIQSLAIRDRTTLAKSYDRLQERRDYLVAWVALVRVLQRLPYSGELYWTMARLFGGRAEMSYNVFSASRGGLFKRFQKKGPAGWLATLPHPYQQKEPDPEIQQQLPAAILKARQDIEKIPRWKPKPKTPAPPLSLAVRLDQLSPTALRGFLQAIRSLKQRQMDLLVFSLAYLERYGEWPGERQMATGLGLTHERIRQLHDELIARVAALERPPVFIPLTKEKKRNRPYLLDNVAQVRQELEKRLADLPPLPPELPGESPEAEETGVPADILQVLRLHPGGPVMVGQLAELAKVSESMLAYYGYRELIDQENAKRGTGEDQRPAIRLVRKPKRRASKGRGGESRRQDIIEVLGNYPGGKITLEQLAELAGVGTRTLFTHHVQQLVEEENGRRATAGEGKLPIEVTRKPRPPAPSVSKVVEALKAHPGGFLTREELVSLAGVASSNLGTWYRGSIEEENARRLREKDERPPIRLITEYEKTAIPKIQKALQEHPGGRLTFQELEGLTEMSTVENYDPHGLIEEENARRASEKPARQPIKMTKRVKGIRALLISSLRNHPGGPLTAVELARLAGVGVHNLYLFGWRDLIAQENGLRESENPRRPPMVASEAGTPRSLPVVVSALRRHPGGPFVLNDFSVFSEVSTNTLIALDYRHLIFKENARRVAQEPGRPRIEIPPERTRDSLEAVVTALHQHPGGALTVEELVTLADIGLTTLSRLDYHGLIAEENAARELEEPRRQPIVLLGPGLPKALVEMIKVLRAHPGGLVTRVQVAQLAGISKDTATNYDFRSLVAQENAQRVIDQRTPLEVRRGEAEVEAVIVAALQKHPGGPLIAKELAGSAEVTEGALISHDYRGLIALENERRTKEEQDRPLIVPPPLQNRNEDPLASITAALREHPGGALAPQELAALADVHLVTLERHGYEQLIVQENARRAEAENSKPEIELKIPPDKPALEKILAFLRGHPGGPLTVAEFVAGAGVSRATLTWWHDYRALVDQENAKRLLEEPRRPPIQIVAGSPGAASGLEEWVREASPASPDSLSDRLDADVLEASLSRASGA